jgi:hypothetical protein
MRGDLLRSMLVESIDIWVACGYMRVPERRKRRLAGRVAMAEVPGATQTGGPIVDGQSLRALKEEAIR